MKQLFVILGLIITLTGCGSAAIAPINPTPTPHTTGGVADKSGSQPGLYFEYPAEWELLEADSTGLLVYSVKDAGLRLTNPGLVAGEVVVQVSATPRVRVESDIANYTVSLAEMTGVEHSGVQLVTVNGFEGYQIIGERATFSVIVTVTEQFGQLVEVIAYTNPTEAEAQRPVIDSIINSAIWKLPTE
jgi:hypothetical protein